MAETSVKPSRLFSKAVGLALSALNWNTLMLAVVTDAGASGPAKRR